MANVFRTQKIGEYVTSLKRSVEFVRDVQRQLNRPSYRQHEIDDYEAELAAVAEWMRVNGKRASQCMPADMPWRVARRPVSA